MLGALHRSGRHQIYTVYPANKLPDMLTDREDSQNLPMGLETDSGQWGASPFSVARPLCTER